MDRAQHILVVDGTLEKPSNIAFLLKLAGFEVNVFDDELEACNWLLQQNADLEPARMLLLHEPRHQRSLYALLFQLRQRFKQLQLLLVAAQPLALSGLLAEINPPVHQCRPHDVHGVTRQIFRESRNASVIHRPHPPAALSVASGNCGTRSNPDRSSNEH